MTRQLEALTETKQARRIESAGKSVVYQLEGHLGRASVRLEGLSLRIGEDECLMVLRAQVDGTARVAFVGSGDLAGCLIKATKQAKDSTLNWVPDRYASD